MQTGANRELKLTRYDWRRLVIISMSRGLEHRYVRGNFDLTSSYQRRKTTVYCAEKSPTTILLRASWLAYYTPKNWLFTSRLLYFSSQWNKLLKQTQQVKNPNWHEANRLPIGDCRGRPIAYMYKRGWGVKTWTTWNNPADGQSGTWTLHLFLIK